MLSLLAFLFFLGIGFKRFNSLVAARRWDMVDRLSSMIANRPAISLCLTVFTI